MKILLVCAGGASTSFLATSMRKAAKQKKLDVEIAAHPFSSLSTYISGTDVVLIAPQAMYGEKEIRKVCEAHGVACAPMNSLAYRMINGEKLLADALAAIGK